MSPVVRQDCPTPLRPSPRLAVAPFAQAEKDGASGGAQGVAHFLVGSGAFRPWIVAPVVFEIIHSPRRVGLGVLVFVAPAAGPAAASMRARIGIDAQLQSLGMDIVGQRFDAGRKPCWIRQNFPLRIALLRLPEIINVDVLVARGFHAVGGHGVGGFADQLLADPALKFVPTVPAHLRCHGELPKVFLAAARQRRPRRGA